MDRGVRVLTMSDLHTRSVEGPRVKRARLEAASRWRVLAALEVPLARRDEILERQELHHRCRQG